MSDTLKFGIQSVSGVAGDFIDEFSAKGTVDVAERRNNKGVIKKVYPHNPTTDLTIKGGGDPLVAAGVATNDQLGLAAYDEGVIVVKTSEKSEKNTDFDEFSLDAKHYPEGEIGSES